MNRRKSFQVPLKTAPEQSLLAQGSSIILFVALLFILLVGYVRFYDVAGCTIIITTPISELPEWAIRQLQQGETAPPEPHTLSYVFLFIPCLLWTWLAFFSGRRTARAVGPVRRRTVHTARYPGADD